ncbi:MAG: CaiB/BaiF CoA-transferase family protein [Hyphomonadaceae bacterium]
MITSQGAAGPLSGVRVLEFASIGPGPFCAMLLSDLGADVVRIERPDGVGGTGPNAVLQRGRRVLTLDLKQAADVAMAREAARCADVLIEGGRPGVMERLGLGPTELCASNERLIYARMTGFGQSGPLAEMAGHDINYLAITGVLELISVPGAPPRAPLNLLGDFGGGALYLAFGIAAALHERAQSGRGQVIDAAIIDGAASLAGMMIGAFQTGSLSPRHDANVLAGACPFYRCYACSDGLYIAVGALEPKFYRAFMTAMGLDDYLTRPQRDPAHWPELTAKLEALFASRPRAEWLAVLEPLDACINAVLSLNESFADPHIAARETYASVGAAMQPAPAPRFSRTPGAVQAPLGQHPESGAAALQRWGVEGLKGKS